MAALTDRFSPFGIVLFAALLIGLLFFAYLMTQRGSDSTNEVGDGTEQVQDTPTTTPTP